MQHQGGTRVAPRHGQIDNLRTEDEAEEIEAAEQRSLASNKPLSLDALWLKRMTCMFNCL